MRSASQSILQACFLIHRYDTDILDVRESYESMNELAFLLDFGFSRIVKRPENCHFQPFVDPAELLIVWQIALASSVQPFQKKAFTFEFFSVDSVLCHRNN